jgi:hypothetical protein
MMTTSLHLFVTTGRERFKVGVCENRREKKKSKRHSRKYQAHVERERLRCAMEVVLLKCCGQRLGGKRIEPYNPRMITA